MMETRKKPKCRRPKLSEGGAARSLSTGKRREPKMRVGRPKVWTSAKSLRARGLG